MNEEDIERTPIHKLISLLNARRSIGVEDLQWLRSVEADEAIERLIQVMRNPPPGGEGEGEDHALCINCAAAAAGYSNAADT
jgi:hypothetical protein